MAIPKKYDERIAALATGKQLDRYKSYCELGSHSKVAKACGCVKSAVGGSLSQLEKKAVKAGLLLACDGEGRAGAGREIGKVTTHIRDGEVVQQWVRSDDAAADVINKVMEAVEVLADSVRGLSKPVKLPRECLNDLVSTYPLFDKHHGMVAWGQETGTDWDMGIAVATETAVFKRLVDSQPASKEALVVFGGDYFHCDDDNQVTPAHKNKVDVDGRSFKVFGEGIRMAKKYVELTQQKHKHTTIEILPGNHDPVLSMALLHVLDSYYENNKRVTVKAKPGTFSYYEFGSTLLCFQHGDKMKQERMYQVVTTDMREAWGRVKHCHIFTGHFHRERTIDIGMCKMESLRTTIPNEAYATESGYRSPRTAYAITFSKKGGEVGRTMQNIV